MIMTTLTHSVYPSCTDVCIDIKGQSENRTRSCKAFSLSRSLKLAM